MDIHKAIDVGADEPDEHSPGPDLEIVVGGLVIGLGDDGCHDLILLLGALEQIVSPHHDLDDVLLVLFGFERHGKSKSVLAILDPLTDHVPHLIEIIEV